MEDYQDLDHASLQRLVSAHEEACKRLREGSATLRGALAARHHEFRGLVEGLMSLKRLAKLLSAEGRLAEMDGRPGDAERSYVEPSVLGMKSAGRAF